MQQAQSIQEEGKKLAEKYQKEAMTMSPSQKAELEKKIKGKQADLEHVVKKLQASRDDLMKQLMAELNVKAMQATKSIIEAEGIGLLLNANPQLVLHADTSFDISAKLTDRLNKMTAAK